MPPSPQANDKQRCLNQFVVSAFELIHFYLFNQGMMNSFDEDEQAWRQGLWIQVGFPFDVDKRGTAYLHSFETNYPPLIRQVGAWERLSSQCKTLSNLVDRKVTP